MSCGRHGCTCGENHDDTGGAAEHGCGGRGTHGSQEGCCGEHDREDRDLSKGARER